MILDESLKCKVDYSEGQKNAAYSVLGEIVTILEPFADDIRIVGGWVPSLLYPASGHIGSIDVDVLLNHKSVALQAGYSSIRDILICNGYRRNKNKFFTFTKTVYVDGVEYDVDVDFLSGMYGGKDGSVSKHVGGIKALPATGGNYAFDFPANDVTIEYRKPNGDIDIGHVRVISEVPYIIMKTAAMGRGKPKDAYDIYTCINNFQGGVRALLNEFIPYKNKEIIKTMCAKLRIEFASETADGPRSIADFDGNLDEEEQIAIMQDAYQKVLYLTRGLE